MFQLAETKDGSSTIINNLLQQSYHSMHGAIQESMHVFIREGLLYYIKHFSRPALRIFEMGYGTGLNALLTYLEASKYQLHIDYRAVELYPLDTDTARKLNYDQQLGLSAEQFSPFYTFDAELSSTISENFKIRLFQTPFEKYLHEPGSTDIFYFDAFSPSAQPELWTIDIMKKCFEMLRSPGVWVTYSSKGDVRRALRDAGFQVEKIPGPPGKREMLRALKI